MVKNKKKEQIVLIGEISFPLIEEDNKFITIKTIDGIFFTAKDKLETHSFQIISYNENLEWVLEKHESFIGYLYQMTIYARITKTGKIRKAELVDIVPLFLIAGCQSDTPKEYIAMELFKQGKITLLRGAKIANMDICIFIEFLGRHGVMCLDCSPLE